MRLRLLSRHTPRGPLGAAAASAAVMTSVFGALNGNLLVGPRLLYAMGADGLAPRLPCLLRGGDAQKEILVLKRARLTEPGIGGLLARR